MVILCCHKEMALDVDGAEEEAEGAEFGMDLWSHTRFPAHQIPWNPTATEMEVPVQPAVADLLLSGLFPVPRGTDRLCRKQKIHSQAWSNVQGFSEFGVITPLITASHSQATPGLLAQTPGAVMGFLCSLWGKGGSRAEHPK